MLLIVQLVGCAISYLIISKVEEVFMDAVLIMVGAFVGYILMYKLYGKFIGRKIFNLSNANKTPAVEF
ncbi:hypothetical protein ES703_123125 [subsurface metagenome]